MKNSWAVSTGPSPTTRESPPPAPSPLDLRLLQQAMLQAYRERDYADDALRPYFGDMVDP